LFIFKKMISQLFFPVPLCIEILILGLILLWFTRRQRVGKIVVSIGVALLTLFSLSSLSDALLSTLEYRFPPLLSRQVMDDVKYVVVLGGGHTSDPRLPVTGQLSNSSLARLAEGIRLHRILPGSAVILSGGGPFDPVPNAEVMAEVAFLLGLNRKDVILESESKDTKDHARYIKKIIGEETFVLVTSASHMPRAMALFKSVGLEPIPAPTDYWTKAVQVTRPQGFFPSAYSLVNTERAFYEYLGLAWAKIRGQI
jgi:uncharacterized SAM-binding protein YcdF (DUF218 family)